MNPPPANPNPGAVPAPDPALIDQFDGRNREFVSSALSFVPGMGIQRARQVVDLAASGHFSQNPPAGPVGMNPPPGQAAPNANQQMQQQMQLALQQALQPLQQQMQQVQQQMQQVLQQVQQGQQRSDARWQNERRRRSNASAPMDAPLLPLEIENVAAANQPLLQLPAGPRPYRVPQGTVRLVSGAVSQVFPATKTDMVALTAHQIAGLAAEYNTDFGIVAGDSLAARVAKLLAWAT